METAQDDLPILPFRTEQEWEDWLEANHTGSRGIWIKLAKKASGISTVGFSDAIDVALCFGWIDGQRRGYDDSWYLQRFTPRRPGSRWSKINVERVSRLTEAGRMRAAGIAQVELARSDGRWDEAYDSPSQIEVPHDLAQAIEAAAATQAFAALKSTDRYSILYRLHHTKRDETRARIIDAFISQLLDA